MTDGLIGWLTGGGRGDGGRKWSLNDDGAVSYVEIYAA